MTSEVALMNRSAVVLAADSAATVKVWQNGEEKERYFKGANKIFNVSSTQAVGVMIYDGAEFQGVPWEVVIKAYRDQKGDASQTHLASYPRDLFDFVVSDPHLFPREQQAAQYREYVTDSALRIMWVAANTQSVLTAPTAAQKSTAKRTEFEEIRQGITASEYFDGVNDAFVQTEAVPHLGDVAQVVAGSALYAEVRDALTVDEIVELASIAVFKKLWPALRTTGVVFAGYGTTEYFPHLVHYRCHGLLFGKLLCEDLSAEAASISVDNVSEIVPLAQSDMIKTFMFGASPTTLLALDRAFVDCLASFTEALRAAQLLPQGDQCGCPGHGSAAVISGIIRELSAWLP